MLDFLARDLLKWPEFTAGDALLSGVVLLVIALIIAAVRFHARRKGRRDASWNILRAHALRRGLDFKEVALLRSFFTEAGRVEEVLMEPGALYKDLRDYLVHHHEVSDRLAVRVLDKFFPSAGREVEVLSLDNLRPGEFCGIEYGNSHYLGRIVKTRGTEILVSLKDWEPRTAGVGERVFVYVFRARMGGYLLHGDVQRVQRDGMIIRFQNKIDTLGERHLMMTGRLPVALYEWPWPPAEGAAEANESEREQIILKGRTEKISDRGLTMTLDTGSGIIADKEGARHDLWRIEFELPSGFRVVCRGRLQPVPRNDHLYYFRYLDPTENARHALFADIREHGGERENLF